MTNPAAVLVALRKHGLLLKQDPKLLNAVTMLTGERLRGSWWSHRQAHAIFRALLVLSANRRVLVTKLVAGKDTLVHRRLWPALLGVAVRREPWQRYGLSASAQRLFPRVTAAGVLQSHGAAARELVQRLLVHGSDVHTPAGHHERRLESWAHWRQQHPPLGRLPTAARARAQLERAVAKIGGDPRLLPWHRVPPPA